MRVLRHSFCRCIELPCFHNLYSCVFDTSLLVPQAYTKEQLLVHCYNPKTDYTRKEAIWEEQKKIWRQKCHDRI